MGENFEQHYNDSQIENQEEPLKFSMNIDDRMEEIPGEVGELFQNFCEKNNLDLKNKIIDRIGYHAIELAKNIADHATSGQIEIRLVGDSIEVITRDSGAGFDPVEDIESSIGGGFGLKETMRYADEFFIETKGAKFQKEITKGKRKKLVEKGPSDVTTGSKVTFLKRFKIIESK